MILSPRPRPSTRRARATTVVVGVLVLPLIACSDSDEPASTPEATSTSAAVAGPGGSSTTTTVGEVLGDGEHVGYITGMQETDDGSYSLGFDLAYLLTGDEATAAATGAGVDLDTDYYIQNDSPRQRSLTLDPRVVITVVGEGDACCESVEIPLREFEERISPTFDPTTDVRTGPLVRITVDRTRVTRIDEIYLA